MKIEKVVIHCRKLIFDNCLHEFAQQISQILLEETYLSLVYDMAFLSKENIVELFNKAMPGLYWLYDYKTKNKHLHIKDPESFFNITIDDVFINEEIEKVPYRDESKTAVFIAPARINIS